MAFGRGSRGSDVIGDEDGEYAVSREIRAWRSALRWGRIIRRASPGFTYQAAATAVGTVGGGLVLYLISVAAGLIAATPLGVTLAAVGAVLGGAAVVFRLAPKRLVAARVSELLDTEPGRIVDTLQRIYAPGEYSVWDLFDAVWNLPDPRRSVIVLRFGGPTALVEIGESLALSRERVRQLEGAALADIALAVGASWPRKSSG